MLIKFAVSITILNLILIASYFIKNQLRKNKHVKVARKRDGFRLIIGNKVVHRDGKKQDKAWR